MTTRISLGAAQYETVGGGWPQERYYSSLGETVSSFLSFRSVYEINPFEVGANHASERAVHSARYGVLEKLLDLAPLRKRTVISLSNGELRRVILAKALLRESGTVLIDGGCGGIDAEWRQRIREVALAMRGFGVRLRVAGGNGGKGDGVRRDAGQSSHAGSAPKPARGTVPVVEMTNINLSFGRRTLFKDLSWTIREGERWILHGPNGSGKTMLLALITGDSPFAYACDIKVFGRQRGERTSTLERMRSRIGEVSSARQTYLGVTPMEQLDAALRPGVRLLLLDEPCCDMATGEAALFARRTVEWLDAHPRVAAVWVEHRPERIPPSFPQCYFRTKPASAAASS